MISDISRNIIEIEGGCVAEFTFRITPDARVTRGWIRAQLAVEAENIIKILLERSPQVLIE